MEYVVTNAQMKLAEENCNRDAVSYSELMENAGEACTSELRKLRDKRRYITILCGSGSNGGDGFVIARKLAESGVNSTVILLDGEPKTECAREHFEQLFGIVVLDWKKTRERCENQIILSDIIVDCVFGTGFHGTLPPHIAQCMNIANRCDMKIAVDVPTGVNSDTGEADENAFIPTNTFILAAMKKGLLSLPCNDMLGEVSLLDIGIGNDAYGDEYVAEISDMRYANPFEPRKKSSHKGTYGKLLNIAGSLNYSGAAALSTMAALRTGVGLCTLATPLSVVRGLAGNVTETTFLPLPETDDGFVAENVTAKLGDALSNATAVCVGCGLGKSEATRSIVEFVIKNATCPVIIDADGINSISDNIDILKERRGEIILTPHPMEFSRISGMSVSEIQSDRLEAARKFAVKYGIYLILKGYNTIISTPSGKLSLNPTGNTGLAKGGSGDVLSGIVSAMAAQGIPTGKAAVAGAYCHGLCADILAKEMPPQSILPSDIVSALHRVYSLAP